jgi:hypothetical protein
MNKKASKKNPGLLAWGDFLRQFSPSHIRGKARVSVKPNRTSSMKHFFQAAKLGHHSKIELSICSIVYTNIWNAFFISSSTP